jgi:hypothetical protein
VTVNGNTVGTAPVASTLFVEPGTVVVEAKLAGYVGVRRELSVAKGSEQDVTLALVQVAPPPVEKRPLWPALVTGGAALVAIGVGAGFTGAASAKRADAETVGMKLGAVVCTGTPASGAALDCQRLQSDIASHDTLNRAALGSFIVGGALAVAGAGLGAWVATVPKDNNRTASMLRVAPLASRSEAGVVVLGSW